MQNSNTTQLNCHLIIIDNSLSYTFFYLLAEMLTIITWKKAVFYELYERDCCQQDKHFLAFLLPFGTPQSRSHLSVALFIHTNDIK